jgi:hypothetical protein
MAQLIERAGLTWAELDILLAYIIKNRKELRKHIQSFGYPKAMAGTLIDDMQKKLAGELLAMMEAKPW